MASWCFLPQSITLVLVYLTVVTNHIPQMNETYSTSIIISWIYNKDLMIFTLFIISYLLMTLVVVVNITNMFKSPLRLSA